MELGVPKGPMFSRLQKGETLEIEGRLITPEMVCDPPDPTPVFAIIDIQSEAELVQFEFAFFEQYNEPGWNLTSIVHMSPSHILNSTAYKQFIASLPSSTKHVMLNTDYAMISLREHYVPIATRSFRNQQILTQVSPEVFPELHTGGCYFSQNCVEVQWEVPVVIPKYFMKIVLSPRVEVDETDCIVPDVVPELDTQFFRT